MNNCDVAIIGGGVAGVFAALKIAKERKGTKTIIFELGRPHGKRRIQCNGFFGLFPNSDGKLYLSDIQKIVDVAGTAKTNAAFKWFNNYVSNVFDPEVVKDPGPKVSAEKKIKKAGYEIVKNDYIQVFPREIHLLSKKISNDIENYITPSFDNEVLNVVKHKNHFIITTSSGEVKCKKMIVCTGRSGWRWTKSLYDSLGIIKNNDTAKFGIRIEASASVMKDFHKSSCSIKNSEIEMGPMCWNGTVIPEDHLDFAISSFRSNEARWKSDKVSFNLIGNRFFEGNGFEQTSRIGQLTFVLSNDRVVKERISTLTTNKSKISIIPEYDWLPRVLEDVSAFIPDLITKGYFHVPTILPLIPKIKIKNNFCTEVDGVYCAGEAAGVVGLLSAAVSGIIAGGAACR